MTTDPASKLWRIALRLTIVLATLGGVALAQPGELLELTPMGVLSPGEIESRTAGRFRNNGEPAPSARTPVATYLMRYSSLWPDGEPAEITAQLFVPQQLAEPGSLLVFGPGSTGLVEACSPSYDYARAGVYDTYGAYTLAYAGQGLASVMPNYMGFFDVGTIQPYFDRVAEGRVMLDALRAAQTALERLEAAQDPLPAFVAGYSQGGHAAFAAADLHGEYAPETELAGVLGFGPTTLMSALFLEFTFVAPWVIHSYSVFHPDRIDPSELLLEPYLSRLAADAERLCILEAQSYYPASPEGLFRPEFVAALRNGTLAADFPTIGELFAANDAGLARHGFPTIILQGVDDPVVPIETQNRFVARLCENGSAVRYPNYLRTRHETRYIGFYDAIGWMRDIAAGNPAPSDCADVVATP